ncbi:MAG TPA: nitroreductase [Firmicutes bacterium]|nr:MAG: nitroreductase [Peptococcaceae bacterium 1109]HHT73981.1 nitroreductase [Bacillota bacterium]
MDVRTAIEKRRSIRKYASRELTREEVDLLLTAAQLAPSARNRQEWRFIAVTEKELIQKVAQISGQDFLGGAPMVIAGVGLEPTRVMRCGIPPYIVDVTIALTQVSLLAVEMGLGTCWIGGFPQEEMRQLLGIPEEHQIVQLMAVGYPEEEPAPRPRRPFAEIVSYNKF